MTIVDEGAGFDWREYLDPAPERAFDAHGWGIAMARSSGVDQLAFEGCGNSVTATWLVAAT